MVIELLAGTMRRRRGGIAAAEDMRQAYIVKHIRKGLTLLGSAVERASLPWGLFLSQCRS